MSIFPNIVRDLNLSIISYLDGRDLIRLSRVNKAAYQTISNDTFKKLFIEKHPQFNSIKNEFVFLCDNYPKVCWKIACCVLLKAPRLRQSLLADAVPKMIAHLMNRQVSEEKDSSNECSYLVHKN